MASRRRTAHASVYRWHTRRKGTYLGLALPAAFTCYRCDLPARRPQRIRAGNGRRVLPPRVGKGAPKSLFGCQRGFVICSGGRCQWANHKVGLVGVEVEGRLAFVPLRGLLTDGVLAKFKLLFQVAVAHGDASRRSRIWLAHIVA